MNFLRIVCFIRFFFDIMNSVKKRGDKEHREAKRSNGYAPCEQSLSKTHQRARKGGSAENVSSLLGRSSPTFWAIHSGETGLGKARIIFLTRRRSKSSLQYEN